MQAIYVASDRKRLEQNFSLQEGLELCSLAALG